MMYLFLCTSLKFVIGEYEICLQNLDQVTMKLKSTEADIKQLFSMLLSDICFMWQGRADIGRNVNCFIIHSQNVNFANNKR